MGKLKWLSKKMSGGEVNDVPLNERMTQIKEKVQAFAVIHSRLVGGIFERVIKRLISSLL